MLAYFKITSYNKYNKDSSGDGWFLVVWWCMPNMYNMHKDVQCMPLFFVGVFFLFVVKYFEVVNSIKTPQV